jgi:DNA-binding response OmpR family regulator
MIMQQNATYPASDPTPMPFPAPARASILIVDDEPRIRLALRGCLENEGYEVDEARDGNEAVQVILDSSPDLMLLDLAMPRLDGMSTLRILHERHLHVMPRVIVFTAWGSPALQEEAQRYGVSECLTKPLLPDALRTAVARVLRTPRPGELEYGDAYVDEDRPFGDLYLG